MPVPLHLRRKPFFFLFDLLASFFGTVLLLLLLLLLQYEKRERDLMRLPSLSLGIE